MMAGPLSGPRSSDRGALVTGPSSPPPIQITESSRSVRAVQSNARRAPESRASRRGRLAVVMGLSVLMVVGLIMVRQRVVHTSPAPLPSAAASGSAILARPSVHLHVHVVPIDAVLSLDDAELPNNPFDGSFAKDALEHRVQASRADVDQPFVRRMLNARLDGVCVSGCGRLIDQ